MKEKFEDRVLDGPIVLTLKDPATGTSTIWRADKGELIFQIQKIMNSYRSQGYVLTLRQLYYQLVKANAIRNHDTIYKKLSSVLDDCRYAGVVDWEGIEDRVRQPVIPFYVDSIADSLQEAAATFRLERMKGQKVHVEVWTEKDALSSILRRATFKYGATLVVNKGYSSSSAMYEAYRRFIEAFKKGQKVVVLYLGDHDPSGLDMVRDIYDRLIFFMARGSRFQSEFGQDDEKLWDTVEAWWEEEMLTVWDLEHEGYLTEREAKGILGYEHSYKVGKDWDGARLAKFIKDKGWFEVKAIGLTMEQIKHYKLPPNPAKITDPRAKDYIKRFGNISWEVDGLEPAELVRLVSANIEMVIDVPMYAEVMVREVADRDRVALIVGEINEKEGREGKESKEEEDEDEADN